MKKLINRFLGVVVVAALLMGTVMPNVAVMAAGGHETDKEVPSTQKGECDYTITLTKPAGVTVDTNAKYGAYQIFTGKVPEKPKSVIGSEYTDDAYQDPGKENAKLPITDIKWGNAFGEVDNDDWRQNIVRFAIALGTVKKSDYGYAFTDFNGFEYNADGGTPLVDENGNLSSTYVIDTTVINNKSSGDDLTKVRYDKLAVAVAEEIAKHDNREWLQAFSDILGGYTKSASQEDVNQSYVKQYYASTKKDDVYEIKVPAGYYMIIDLTTGDLGSNEAYSARMLFVASNIKQVLKEDVPTLDKDIKRDDNQYYDTEVAGVGDVVNFRLTGTLPNNYDNYLGGYQYTFTDTLSDGLNLNGSAADVKVTAEGLFKLNADGTTWEWDASKELPIPAEYVASIVSGTPVDDHTHHLGEDVKNYNYEVTISSDKKKLSVEFPCLKEIVLQEGSTKYRLGYSEEDTKDASGAITKIGSSRIYVDYSATVNRNAVIKTGNKNTAQLTYSNDPQAYDNTDTTNEKKATVYTFGLDIVKIDAADFLKNNGDQTKSALSNAEFAIIRVKPGTTEEYQIAKVYEKSDKSYLIDDWANIEKPASESAADLQTVVDSYLAEASHTGTEWHVTSDENGQINITGLDAGVKYTMVETKTPTDPDSPGKEIYARIDPFDITLKAKQDNVTKEYDGTLESATVTPGVTDKESFSYTKYVKLTEPNTYADGSASMLVANFKYVDLPSTGGIGIYPFYIIGGIVVAGSIILFALSRRKKTA